MGQSLKKNELSGITEDLSGNPATIGLTVRTKANVTPPSPQTADAACRFQHLPRELIRIDDVISEFGKASSRCGLAAADTARESDDHALPYRLDPQRANLKRGWEKTADQGRYLPQGWQRLGRLPKREQGSRLGRRSASGWSQS